MEKEAYKKGNKYVVQAWVSDYGIFDTDKAKFVGSLLSYNEAMIIAKFLNDDNFKLKKQKKSVRTQLPTLYINTIKRLPNP